MACANVRQFDPHAARSRVARSLIICLVFPVFDRWTDSSHDGVLGQPCSITQSMRSSMLIIHGLRSESTFLHLDIAPPLGTKRSPRHCFATAHTHKQQLASKLHQTRTTHKNFSVDQACSAHLKRARRPRSDGQVASKPCV